MNTIYRDSFTGDANKGITKIEYDLLGNPKKISFADRSYIDYVYSADGRRIKTRHFTAVPSSTSLSLGQASTLTSSQIQSVDSTDYIGDFVFENNAFKQYHFFGGYITSSGLPTNYKYYVKDHLGNNRILASYNGTVEQTTHYYPFGATHHLSTNQGAQKYKYNGKEFDAMHGLNWYDYGARQYDPAIGQFTSMDPLCEKYYHISPYAYCGGNPVKRIDRDGKDWYDVLVGTVIGIATDVVPFTGNARDLYEAHDPADYNRGLKIADNAAMTIGALMEVDGGGKAIGGLAVLGASGAVTVTSGGTASPVTAVTGTASVEMIGSGAIECAAGMVVMANTQGNSNKGYDRGNKTSGEKNMPHANQKRKSVAEIKYNNAKAEYYKLSSKTNKTPEEKQLLEKLRKQVTHLKEKMDFTGENHSRNPKGNR